MSNNTCEDQGHTCDCRNQTASQTLDELAFERGIWSAAQYGDLDRVKKLIESGKSNVDERDSAGYTALHYAARNGHLNVCEYLISQKANIDAMTKSGQATALHRACAAGETKIVKFLLSRRVDVTLQDSDGKTALHRAIENNHREIIEILVRNYPLLKDIPDNKGHKPNVDNIYY